MNLVGTWNLQVATPFGTHPATLVFKGTGGALSGSISSRLGDAPLEGLTVTHDGFDAQVSMDFQGKPYGANIAGQVEDDSISGTIKVKHPIAPTIRYTGTRG
ncbi:MAG: hypothetical protein QOJ76_3097 [Acidobacteriota bacterium]|jgi:hypothetical protein|nr:hypothetical protein [Acidobacteriota bacterium]